MVALIGAGELGGAVAHALARRARVGEVRLIDAAGGVAAGKALDIRQAGPIERVDVRVSGGPDLTAAAGAAVVVLCDCAGSPGAEWEGDAALAHLRELVGSAARPPLVCAGSGQREVIGRAVLELGWPRDRIVGSAPEALASALRAMVALEADCSPQEVALTAAGLPCRQLVIGWNDGSIAGEPLARVLPAVSLARLERRAARLWPPGPYALAAAAAQVVEGLVHGLRRRFTCLAALDGELGVRRRVAAVPVRLAAPGLVRIVPPVLAPRERVAFETALEVS